MKPAKEPVKIPIKDTVTEPSTELVTGPITFGIIGGAGFRAQYFLRIAQALPHKFRVSGLVVRDHAKRAAMIEKWGLPAFAALEQMLSHEKPDFVVVSVSGTAGMSYCFELAELGIPVLLETPPAASIADMERMHEKLTLQGARVQVAEQYHLHPHNQARLAFIQSGKLGMVTEAAVSISHLYHGVSLIRRMLGLGYELPVIKAHRFETRMLQGPTRNGPPTEDKLIAVQRDLAWLDFGDKLGIYDFTKDQHRSWIRSNYMNIRGERGEIFDNRVIMQQPDCVPLQLDLKRVNKGELENQEGYFLQGVLFGEKWLYTNPYAPARLYDDEIAIAECLHRMGSYVKGGPEFYSLAEASQDHYIGMLIEQALQTGDVVKAERQCWNE